MNSIISQYIKQNIKYPLLIEDIPADDLNVIIVIPCRNDSKITDTVQSIYKANEPGYSIEITIIIYADRDDELEIHNQNINSDTELHALNDLPNWCRLYVIMNNNFSSEKANAEFTSKIGMDDAVRRFDYMQNADGIIVQHESNNKVKDDYFSSINQAFASQDKRYHLVSNYCNSRLQ